MINFNEETQKIVFGVLFSAFIIAFIPIITILLLGFMKLLEITIILSGITITLYFVWKKYKEMKRYNEKSMLYFDKKDLEKRWGNKNENH